MANGGDKYATREVPLRRRSSSPGSDRHDRCRVRWSSPLSDLALVAPSASSSSLSLANSRFAVSCSHAHPYTHTHTHK
eukprot:6046268-Pyramimonas_sp.AAC.1